MHTETYQTYMRLLEELNALIAKNLGNSPAAEKVRDLIRDLMDNWWYLLLETEIEEINKDIRSPFDFWHEVDEKLRGWGYANPSEVLKAYPNDTEETLREILKKERMEKGDEAAIKKLGRLISAITGSMG